MLPDAVRRANARAMRASPPLPWRGADGVTRAGIARASEPGRRGPVSRIVAVAEINEHEETAEIFLITNEVEQATDLDLIVEPESTGLPWRAVVQGELYGPILLEQLDPLPAEIPPQELRAVARAVRTDGESLRALETGSALGDWNDPRREFKDQELDDLRALIDACRDWRSGKAEIQLLDPSLLKPPPPGSHQAQAENQYLKILNLLEDMGKDRIEIEAGMLLAIVQAEWPRWWSDFHLDMARAVEVLDEPGPTADTFSEYAVERARTIGSTVDVYTVGSGPTGLHDVQVVHSQASSPGRLRLRRHEEI